MYISRERSIIQSVPQSDQTIGESIQTEGNVTDGEQYTDVLVNYVHMAAIAESVYFLLDPDADICRLIQVDKSRILNNEEADLQLMDLESETPSITNHFKIIEVLGLYFYYVVQIF